MPLTASGVFNSSPVIVPVDASPPTTVTVVPGAGCTVKVEFSTTPNSGFTPATPVWQTWPNGTVSAVSTDVFQGRLMALRFTRMSGSADCSYEVLS